MDDLERLQKDYSINAIDFADTNFFVSKKLVRAICEEIIRRGLDLTELHTRLPVLPRAEAPGLSID